MPSVPDEPPLPESTETGPSETPNRLQISRKRVWFFRLISLAIGLLPVVGLEMYLRRSAPVDSDRLANDPIFDTTAQTRLFVPGIDPDRLHIPDSRLNFFRPAEFSREKSPHVLRVFVLGGSTVQGRPYETETSFAKWAELWLQASQPDRTFEVINCGGVSYASYRVAIILEEVLGYAPDAIVLYTGHNEFLEERSYGDRQTRQSGLNRLAGRLRIVQKTRSLFSPPPDKQALSPEAAARLDLANGLERYVRDDHWKAAVETHFAHTFEKMLQACQSAGVPLITCVPTGDIVNTPPFKSEAASLSARGHQQFSAAWKVAIDADQPVTNRISACRECLTLDAKHAGVNFLIGKLLWDRGETVEAVVHLTAARDEDVCPLRATSPIIETVQSMSSSYGISISRCDQLLDQSDSKGRAIPDGVADPHRFVDHIHPSVAGHQIIGRDIGKRLSRLWELSPEAETAKRFEMLMQRHLATLDESYFSRAEQRRSALMDWAAGRSTELSLPSGP